MHWLAILNTDSFVTMVFDFTVPDLTTWSSPDGTNNRCHEGSLGSFVSWIHPPRILENGTILSVTIWPESVRRPPNSTIRVSVGMYRHMYPPPRVSTLFVMLQDLMVPQGIWVEKGEHSVSNFQTSRNETFFPDASEVHSTCNVKNILEVKSVCLGRRDSKATMSSK